MTTLEALVAEPDNGNRVWKFVISHWKAVVKSREHMRKCFKREEVSVNGSIAEVTRILQTGDVVRLQFDSRAAHESVYGRENLDVRYEDSDLAVVVKPSGKTMVALGFMLPFSLGSGDVVTDQAAVESAPRRDSITHTEGRLQRDERDLLTVPSTMDDDGDDQEDNEEDFDVPSNISPTLGQQSRLPCAIHGLEKAANGLDLASACGDIQDADTINTVQVVAITPSNEAGKISTLDVTPHSPSMGVNIRRYLLSLQHPVVGESGNTRPLKANRGKGLLSALVKMEFVHPRLGTPVTVSLEEPAKFEQLRKREEKACLRRQVNDHEELKKGGLELEADYDRKANRPIAYLVGEKDFYGLRFKVSPSTLIPRSSTETLVDAAIALAQRKAVKILDVGTGSGCLLLALLSSLPLATGTGVDISEDALGVARANGALHDLNERASFCWADLANLRGSSSLFQSFNLLVCNPPYLDGNKASKLKMLFSGTEYEPSVALFADNEGYGAYELLAASLLRDIEATGPMHIMDRAGHVILEVGSGMGRRVREIFKFLHFEYALKDNQDSERCLVFSLSGPSMDSITAAAEGITIA
ncbi:hypothetical protein BGZ70_008505 [Mortierella alpina]|uniref:peptide chain release factor N(5)-glutamine methyltransferase n=1 Tax=Mortierella alpina TaxID=64518 RepID=A0A9P6J6J5_MORAP|nr:hypothetical protein BGZ70_008505 [Mortierella alpina]